MLGTSLRASCVAAFVLLMPFNLAAYERHGGQADERLAGKYARFAGSHDNAQALVEGLRYDRTVKLSSPSGSTSFAPHTDKMGYGNVDHALALAKLSLAQQGIRNPTPEQIKAALNGGTVTSKSGQRVVLPGVLKQRASGMGWGQIAQSYGFKLGELMRAEHGHHRATKEARNRNTDRVDFHRTRHERPERPEKFDKPERPERPERGGRR